LTLLEVGSSSTSKDLPESWFKIVNFPLGWVDPSTFGLAYDSTMYTGIVHGNNGTPLVKSNVQNELVVGLAYSIGGKKNR